MKIFMILLAFATPLMGGEKKEISITIQKSNLTDAERVELFLSAYDALIAAGREIFVSREELKLRIDVNIDGSSGKADTMRTEIVNIMRGVVNGMVERNMKRLVKKIEEIRAKIEVETNQTRRQILEQYLDVLVPTAESVRRIEDPIKVVVK